MTATNYTEDKVLAHGLGFSAWTMPAAMNLSLHTASPTDTGSFANEIAPAGYGRQAATFISGGVGSAKSFGAISFTSLVWAAPTAVSHWGLDDGTNMLFHGAFTETKTYSGTDTVTIPDAGITVTCD